METQNKKIIQEKLAEASYQLAREINGHTEALVLKALDDGSYLEHKNMQFRKGDYYTKLCNGSRTNDCESLSKLVEESLIPANELRITLDRIKNEYSPLYSYGMTYAKSELELFDDAHKEACYRLASLKPWGERQ